MTVYFLDSSALVKRYIAEVGTAWIQILTDAETGNLLFMARIAWIEVLSAFARRQREGLLNRADVNELMMAFRSHLNHQYEMVEVDAALAETAGQLAMQHPLRAYDAVQLAGALRVQTALGQGEASTLMFISADERLLAVARTMGLATDNPNQHP